MNYIRSYVMNAISLPKNERGFTLIELLILIGFITVCLAFLIAAGSMFGLFKSSPPPPAPPSGVNIPVTGTFTTMPAAGECIGVSPKDFTVQFVANHAMLQKWVGSPTVGVPGDITLTADKSVTLSPESSSTSDGELQFQATAAGNSKTGTTIKAVLTVVSTGETFEVETPCYEVRTTCP